MVLYCVYRNSNEKPEIEKKINSSEQQLKTIVVMSPLGVSEVHPVMTESVGPLSDAVHHEDLSKSTKEEEPSIENGKCHVEHARPETV